MSLPKMGKFKLDQDRHAFLEKLNESMFIKAEMISACSLSKSVCIERNFTCSLQLFSLYLIPIAI